MDNMTPVYARVVVRELVRRGLSVPALFRNTTLTKERLDIGDNISSEDYVTLLKNALQLSGDPTLGFMIGRTAHVVSLGPLGAALTNAPTLRDCLRLMEAFSRLVGSFAVISFTSTLQGLSMGLELRGLDAEMERLHVEAGFLLLQRFFELMDGRPLTGAEILVGYAAPGHAELYAEAFQNPVTFNAGKHAINLPAFELDAPSPFYNADVWHQGQFFLDKMLKELTKTNNETYTQHVRSFLRSSEPPLPELSSVAGKMHVSERTLNRRLRGEGTSFRDIRSRELRSWARRYLTSTDLSVDAIAAVLGYHDAANFRRAFRGWENCSPAQFRCPS
jgi:AraC-like DNA-binding protein